MDRPTRLHIAKVLRAAATALDGAFDPRHAMAMQRLKKQRASWTPLILYRISDPWDNKQTLSVFLDGGRLQYLLRSDWTKSGTPLALSNMSARAAKELPKSVDEGFPSVRALKNHILSLLKKHRVKVVKVEQLEELD